MSFVLYYPQKSGATETVTLPNPETGNAENLILGQSSGRTRGGGLYVYDKNTSRREMEFEFVALDDDDKEALDEFFRESANGMVNEFQIDDHHGATWDARFLQSELNFECEGETVLGGAVSEWIVSFKLQLSETS